MKTITLALAGLLSTGATAQIVIQQTQTPAELVGVLLGTGVQVSNVTFNGVPDAPISAHFGSFDGQNCNVGMDQGVVLANGDVVGAVGPNDVNAITVHVPGNNSDGDLLVLANGATVNDAAVLEFDFIPAGDSILIQFVFASEEYLEFVNSDFSDPFGFFLSGPGITGPYMNNAINIALVPGTLLPVSINTVNDSLNAIYYVDNGDGFTAPYSTDSTYIQYDGLTVPMLARAAVVAGQVYHIKIAISDAGDSSLDSAVFLSAGSFMSPDPSTGIWAHGSTAIGMAPNPASDRVRLTWAGSGEAVIRAYDPLGREMLHLVREAGTAGMRSEILDVSGWTAGSYRLTIASGDGLVSVNTLVVLD